MRHENFIFKVIFLLILHTKYQISNIKSNYKIDNIFDLDI
jgi:hypothetical protein